MHKSRDTELYILNNGIYASLRLYHRLMFAVVPRKWQSE